MIEFFFYVCLVVNAKTVNNFAHLFHFTPVGRTLRLNDGSGIKLVAKLAGPGGLFLSGTTGV